MAKVIIVQNPYHEYATRFIEHIYGQYGYRAVCYFTDRKRRAYEADNYPIFESNAVAARFDVEGIDLPTLGARIAAEYDAAAVIPYNEECVLAAAELGSILGIEWNDLAVMRRFRDKFALKEHLRQKEPTLRVNASFRVRSLKDVYAHGEPPFSRYVIKPNSGFGNRNIGIFDHASPRAEVGAFIARAAGAPLVLEEFVGGREYFVNGQTNAAGEPEVVAIFEYARVAANGRANLDYQTHLVRHDSSTFTLLADYAKRVVLAAGLLRSPFHLELKVDENGPCLIEVGARLAGHRNAFVCNAVHGGAIDVFDVAAHYYLSNRDYGPLPLDWKTYDAMHVRYVNGIATSTRKRLDARGIKRVERLASFQSWAKKPNFGARSALTVDCLTMPWSVVLAAPSSARLDEDEALVRSELARAAAPLSPEVAARRVGMFALRAKRALTWQVQRHTKPERPEPGPPGGKRMLLSLLEKRALFTRRKIIRKLQEAQVGRRFTAQVEVLSPERVKVATEMLDWARRYLGQPHPELGRKGPVCPFIAKTLAANRFFITVHDEVGRSTARIRDIVLSHADAFRVRYPVKKEAAASLLLVMPKVAPGVLDEIHDETKTHLMKRKLMMAAIHPESTRPAIWNPSFPVLRAPIPCFAIRHMVVQDIVFVGHNREAMLTYQRHFGDLFTKGKVSNEFGYVDMYHDARSRFRMI